MRIFDVLSSHVRVGVFMVGLRNEAPVCESVVDSSVVGNSRKEGSRINARMQRDAFRKGGYVRLTVEGKIEFVPCAAIVARRIEEAANKLVEVMDAILRPMSTVNTIQEVSNKTKVEKVNKDRNGIRFI